MKLKFLGSDAKLRKCVSRTGVVGHWREIKGQQIQYRTDDGALLNWWESTGTVTFQGRKQAIRKLRGPFVRAALRKGLLEDKSATDEFDDLKKQLNGALIDIANLQNAVAKLKKMVAMRWDNEAREPF
jgi:hypothetical protein